METLGFLLTRQWRDSSDGIELIFWLAADEGPVRVTVSGQESVFFVPVADLEAVEDLLGKSSGWRHASVALADFHLRPMEAIYFKSRRAQLEARDRLMRRDLHPAEADIKPTDRYLMERFVKGAALIKGEGETASGFIGFSSPSFRPASYEPRLKCVSIDIETSVSENVLLSIAVFDDASARVFMVADEPGASGYIEFLPDESALITRFLRWIRESDPDLLIGWNLVNFDLWYLQERANAHGLDFTLGRDQQPVEWRAGSTSERRFAVIPGRVALDGIEMLRSASYNFESYSLEHVAQTILGRGKLLANDDEKARQIEDLYRHEKGAFAEYNLEDCRLVWEIFAAKRLINFAIERSRLTGLELDRQGGSVAAFDYLYLPPLHRHGYVAPAGSARIANMATPGGHVLDSLPGIYEDVIVLDFKSLYPSIIRSFHVDPLAMAEAEKSGATSATSIPGFEGAHFSRDRFLLPTIIAELWQARDQAKQQHNGVLSQAIKIIMNSFYGVLGSPGCRFFDPRLVSSITLRGHEILRKTRDLIEDRGYAVIYGDTDSVFVWLNTGGGNGLVDETGAHLAAELNDWWRRELAERFGIESHLELQYETHYVKFLMPKLRGSERGSKKRYAGMVLKGGASGEPPRPELVFKGLESVRSDWTRLAREFQIELYRRVFLGEPFADYIRATVRSVLQGSRDEDLVLRKRVRRGLAEYKKNIPPHIQAAIKADLAREQLGLPRRYSRGGWIEYVNTVNGPEPVQYRSSSIDHQSYIDKQLAPIADAILTFKSTSMSAIIDRQLGLF